MTIPQRGGAVTGGANQVSLHDIARRTRCRQTYTPYFALAEITLPAADMVPPMVFPGALSIVTPSKLLPTAVLPDASVPIRFPWTRFAGRVRAIDVNSAVSGGSQHSSRARRRSAHGIPRALSMRDAIVQVSHCDGTGGVKAYIIALRSHCLLSPSP